MWRSPGAGASMGSRRDGASIEHFSLEAMVERYGQLYEELLGERSS